MKYFSFETDGGEVVIENNDTYGGTKPVSISSSVMASEKKLEEVLNKINYIIPNLRKNLKESIGDAEEVRVDFGIKLEGKIGLIITSSNVEANFKVSVLWKKLGENS